MLLTQRSADIAKKWILVKTYEMIECKKQQEKMREQIDYDDYDATYSFCGSEWYCRVEYTQMNFIIVEFGYKLRSQPDYMRKIICEDTLPDDSLDFTNISKEIDSYVGKEFICSFCDNGNKIAYEGMCKHCYIFGTTFEDDCAICLTKDFGVWLQTPCNHKFHYKCYNKMKEKICPLCRTQTVSGVHLLDT